jgi:hypothetical protein
MTAHAQPAARGYRPRWWELPRRLTAWVGEYLFASGPTTVIAGLAVNYDEVLEGSRPAVLAKLAAALSLIERYDPRRLRRLVEHGVRIYLGAFARRGNMYSQELNMIRLGSDIMDGSPTSVALVIIHEAAHARIEGLVHQTRRNIARAERRCVEEQIAFSRRMPSTDTQEWEHWEAAMRARLAKPWWTPRARLRSIAEAMIDDGADTWFWRLVKRLA